MNFTDRKLEISIAGFAILMLGGMGYLLKSPVQSALKEMEIVYEMPRPKSILSALFDLGGREISRDYKNPFEKNNKNLQMPAVKTDAKQAATNPVAKNAKNKAPKKKVATQDKKPSVTVNVVEAADEKASFSESFDNSAVGRRSGTHSEKFAGPKDSSVEAQEGLSGDQWRALLQAEPTQENVLKLILAYENKEIDSQTFYMIVTDLLRSNKSESQGLGLMALKRFYSARSFALVAQYYDQLTSEGQKSARSYMMTYATSGRLGMLASVLQSESSVIVSAATEVILNGYQAAKGGQTTISNPRSSRGDVVVNSLASYSKFIPVFQQLAQSQDGDIVAIASAALSQIKTSSVAAL